MFSSENRFVPKNTPIHNLNPIVKFIIFLSIVFLLFLRIPLLVQILLVGFVAIVTWKSDSMHLCKKILVVYAILFCFLYVVNFFFMKSPGFWTETKLSEYRDLLGIYDHTGVKDGNKLMHGWFFGGEVLKDKNGNNWLGNKETARCLEYYLGVMSGNCGHENHSQTDVYLNEFQNLSSSSRWNIFPVVSGDQIRFAAFSPTWYTISLYQVIHAFSLSNKIVLIILLSAIFTQTTSLSSFAYALEDLLKPLRLFRLPNNVMALAIAIAIRFVPSLITEAFRITRAQASRGIDYKNGRFKDKTIALLSLFVPLFVISFIKAGELSETMIARGYNHHHSRNEYTVHPIRGWELIVLFCSMAFITCLYYFFMNSFYLGVFMDSETLVLVAR